MSSDPSKPPAQPGLPASNRPPSADERFKRFDLWLENSHEITAELTLDGRIVYVSPNVKTVLGYDPDDALGLQVLAHVHHEEFEQIQAQIAAPLGWVTCRVRHQDGSWRWIEASGQRFSTPDGH